MSASFRDDPQALWPQIIIVLKGTCMLVFKELTGDPKCLLRVSQQMQRLHHCCSSCQESCAMQAMPCPADAVKLMPVTDCTKHFRLRLSKF